MRTTDWEGGLKVCLTCGVAKSTHDYWADSTNDDGLQPTCKSCHADLKAARERVPLTDCDQPSLLPDGAGEEAG